MSGNEQNRSGAALTEPADFYDGIVERLDIVTNEQGPLCGLSFAAKDLFDVQGYVTGFGNPDWKKTHQPAKRHAKSVAELLNAGARLVAITCSDEMACSLDGINIHFGTPFNPQLPDRIPGGSSSGSASMVASRLVDFALGTDTAGSTRVPASYCGIYGFRPTHGSVSVDGVLALNPTFDTVGILANSPEILAKVAGVLIEDNQSKRATKLLMPTDFSSVLDREIAPRLMAHAERLKGRFDSVRETDIYAKGRHCFELFKIMRGREAWKVLGGWMESARPNLAPNIAQRIWQCKDVSEEEALKVAQERSKELPLIDELLNADTVACLPTTWNFPPLKSASDEELQLNRTKNVDLLALASFYGLPQVSIPVEVGFGVKLGLSLIGGRGCDLALLQLANTLSDLFN